MIFTLLGLRQCLRPRRCGDPCKAIDRYTGFMTRKNYTRNPLLLFSFQFWLRKFSENIVVKIKKFRGGIDTLPIGNYGCDLLQFDLPGFRFRFGLLLGYIEFKNALFHRPPGLCWIDFFRE